MYILIQKLIAFRKAQAIWNLDQVQRYADDQFYAFTRENLFFAFTNSSQYTKRNITYHPYKNGQVLCNMLYPADCVTVSNSNFDVTLINGEFKIFVPNNKLSEDGAENEEMKMYKKLLQ